MRWSGRFRVLAESGFSPFVSHPRLPPRPLGVSRFRGPTTFATAKAAFLGISRDGVTPTHSDTPKSLPETRRNSRRTRWSGRRFQPPMEGFAAEGGRSAPDHPRKHVEGKRRETKNGDFPRRFLSS